MYSALPNNPRLTRKDCKSLGSEIFCIFPIPSMTVRPTTCDEIEALYLIVEPCAPVSGKTKS